MDSLLYPSTMEKIRKYEPILHLITLTKMFWQQKCLKRIEKVEMKNKMPSPKKDIRLKTLHINCVI
jgi:hypothetical protein